MFTNYIKIHFIPILITWNSNKLPQEVSKRIKNHQEHTCKLDQYERLSRVLTSTLEENIVKEKVVELETKTESMERVVTSISKTLK